MPLLVNQLVINKMRRLFKLVALSFFIITIFTISSKWLLSTTIDKNRNFIMNTNNISVNPFLSQDQFLTQINDKIRVKMIDGRPDLAKYIHLDLKGAPPQANKFYEAFFNFIDKLQMGVKGILIEYEDMLPLQGRFMNVKSNE